MSAVVGLIDIAPTAQLDVSSKSSAMGTLGAPLREVPTPLTPGFVLLALRAFHCETCGLGTVIPIVPSVARVSRTIPLTTLGTSSCELHCEAGFATATQPEAAPSAETKVPRGTVWSTPLKVVAPATTP